MNDSANKSDEEIRNLVEQTARAISEHGFYVEKIMWNLNPKQYNFLRSCEDPYHTFYQQKLAEYLPPNTEPSSMITIVESTARCVSKNGLPSEKLFMDCPSSNGHHPRINFNFLRSSEDPYHAIYKRKLSEYLSQPHATIDAKYNHSQAAGLNHDDDLLSHLSFPPKIMHGPLPKGMKRKEFNILKVTAQFRAWYGDGFLAALMKKADPRLEFTKPTDSRFIFFTQFVLKHSQVLLPPKDLEEKLSKSDAFMATILDAFFLRLGWDSFQEAKWEQEGVSALIDWHDSVSKDFAHHEEELPLAEEPNLKLDVSTLVPEDQFLAPYPGPSTIKGCCSQRH